MIEFEYRGFWVEGEGIDQTENGYPKLGVTFTSYVYWSKEDRDNFNDPIEALLISYSNPTDLVLETPYVIDKFIRKHKIKR